MHFAMKGAEYRSAEAAIAQQIHERRLELDRLRAVAPLRRAILPPGTVHEIDGLASRIDAALDRAPGLEVVATLDDLASQLSAVLARAGAEAERMRRRSRELPLPSAPKPFPFGSRRRTFSVERTVREQLRNAQDVREHGVGMLARLEHDGTELVFVARGRGTNDVVFPARKVDCMLRASAPRGPTLVVEPRTLFGRIVRPHDGLAIEPTFDRAFVVKGNPSVTRILLDVRTRQLLLSIRNGFRAFYVGDGVVDLGWSCPFASEVVVLPDEALSIVTSIAERLYAA